MEQRSASKHGGNVPNALISCQIYSYEADFQPRRCLFTGISYLLSSFIFEKYLLYLLLFGYPEREELKVRVRNENKQ